MKRFIKYGNYLIEYDLIYKNVKNINLRIKPNKKITVSANCYVSEKTIEDFVYSKAEFIIRAFKKYDQKPNITPKAYFTQEDVKLIILEICSRVYPYFEKKGICYPEIKFRKMKSRWGSCSPSKKILTFNTQLMYASPECIEYVVKHEFTHFLQANHSKKFYVELEKICPNWKQIRKKLKEIEIGD